MSFDADDETGRVLDAHTLYVLGGNHGLLMKSQHVARAEGQGALRLAGTYLTLRPRDEKLATAARRQSHQRYEATEKYAAAHRKAALAYYRRNKKRINRARRRAKRGTS